MPGAEAYQRPDRRFSVHSRESCIYRYGWKCWRDCSEEEENLKGRIVENNSIKKPAVEESEEVLRGMCVCVCVCERERESEREREVRRRRGMGWKPGAPRISGGRHGAC